MAITVSVSELRANMSAAIDRVSKGQELELTRRGVVVALLVRADRPRANWRHDASGSDVVGDLLHRGRNTPLNPRGTIRASRTEELVADLRRGRGSR